MIRVLLQQFLIHPVDERSRLQIPFGKIQSSKSIRQMTEHSFVESAKLSPVPCPPLQYRPAEQGEQRPVDTSQLIARLASDSPSAPHRQRQPRSKRQQASKEETEKARKTDGSGKKSRREIGGGGREN
jgi:hypothetical protein